jgi:16S rRNA processing protein RimM
MVNGLVLKSSTDFIATGKLLAPFGIKGGMRVKSFSGEVEHFKKLVGYTVRLRRNNSEFFVSVTAVEIKGTMPVLYFKDYPTPEHVKELSGSEIWVERHMAVPLAKDEYYVADLIGCGLIFAGQQIGSIVSYIETNNLLLEVKLADGRLRYVPFIRHFIGTVNLHDKTIELLTDESLN